jgi:hypothetical protein
MIDRNQQARAAMLLRAQLQYVAKWVAELCGTDSPLHTAVMDAMKRVPARIEHPDQHAAIFALFRHEFEALDDYRKAILTTEMAEYERGVRRDPKTALKEHVAE